MSKGKKPEPGRLKRKNNGVQPFDAEDTHVAYPSRGEAPRTRQVLGRLEDEASVSISRPSPLRKGSKKVDPGGVGLRAAPDAKFDDEDTLARRQELKQKVRDGRDERRQKVWDKLDAARKAADEKNPRLRRFEPKRDS